MKFRHVLKWLNLMLLLLPWTAGAQTSFPGEQALATFPWEGATKMVPYGPKDHLQIVDAPPGMGGKMLKISNIGPGGAQVPLLVIRKPPITASFYALRAQVRYEEVAGNGYLEMWNSFPGGGLYFSRTLGDNPLDPMARLSGTADWRTILLPFNAAGASGPPEQLTVNACLPGRGTIYLSELQLVQAGGGKTAGVNRGGWVAVGVSVAGVAAAAGAWAWHRRSRRAEWRRMVALDAR